MKITHAGQQLTDWAATAAAIGPAEDIRCNGTAVADAASVVAAGARVFFYRGNRVQAFSFSRRKQFDSYVLAQIFFLSDFPGLIKKGLCQIECGGPGIGTSQTVFMPDAVLVSAEYALDGLEVVTRFNILGATVSLAPASGYILTEGGDHILTESGDKIETQN